MEALGMIETRGLVALIEAADTALKTARVKLVNYEKSGNGIVTILVRGSVADCKYAVDAASAAAHRIGELIQGHVIPYPYKELEGKLPIKVS